MLKHSSASVPVGSLGPGAHKVCLALYRWFLSSKPHNPHRLLTGFQSVTLHVEQQGQAALSPHSPLRPHTPAQFSLLSTPGLTWESSSAFKGLCDDNGPTWTVQDVLALEVLH